MGQAPSAISQHNPWPTTCLIRVNSLNVQLMAMSPQVQTVPNDAKANTTLIPPAGFGRRGRGRVTVALAIVIVFVLIADVFVVLRRQRYLQEISRLRGGMTEVEVQRTNLLLTSEEKRGQVMMELIRRQARGDQELHLAISVDSGTMHLQREGARLRDMRVKVGAERLIPSNGDSLHLAIPLGTRTVTRLLTGSYAWEVPTLVYSDRGEELPAKRSVAGALGPYAIVLSGGTVIYTLPASGPLADSTYVLPAAVRADVEDMRAVFPNLRPGMRVYFY